jgi:hypothetical protein
METLKVFLFAVALLTGMNGFAGITEKQEVKQDKKMAKVNVYYFHTNTRCVTCRAVESEAKINVEELFGGDVKFTAVNLDEKEGEAKGNELGINSQSLVVFKGDKIIDLTTQGFMYARTNPEKFREIMKEKIQPLL